MKKRINTLMYDTESAKRLGDWFNDYAPNDFQYCHEVLFKKKTGEYFLYGEGGPMSKYWRQEYGNPNGKTGGEDITPLTREEARSWFEMANNADDEMATDEVYQKEFERDDDKVMTSVMLKKKTKIKLEQAALKKGTTQSEIVEKLIEEM
ncbi:MULTISPECIES: hypothetical protein [Lactobacillus]|uniref:hypothetical protein n=1 Tax=Lactobacillus TaxID=1578 RepID=UPI001F2E6B30|nr:MULTISPECIES: hypothetical protein [Lactobacillus]